MSKAIEAGQAAVVTVLAREPGLVELDGLGLSDTAEPGTPARFDVLSTRPGRFAVLFTPAGEPERERVGTLVVRTPRQS